MAHFAFVTWDGLVVDDPLRPDDENTIEVVAAAQKLSGGPLTERLSVFWGTPNTLGGRRQGGRFPALDRLDLLENGRLLVGADVRSGLPWPSAPELIVAGAEFAVEFLAGVQWPASGGQSSLGSMQAAREDAISEPRTGSVILERHLLRRSVDEESRRRGFRFNPDGLHLNSRGAGLLSDVIVEYLETVG